MQIGTETFKIRRGECHHPFNTKSGDFWKSPVKIMLLNVSFICCGGGGCGINNLWNQKSTPVSRATGPALWITLSLLICLLALVPITEAAPAAKSMRDHSRRFFLSPSAFGSSGSPLAPSTSFNVDAGTSATDTLSIFSSLNILRQNMLVEIKRKRMRQKQQQIELNKEYLKRIGR